MESVKETINNKEYSIIRIERVELIENIIRENITPNIKKSVIQEYKKQGQKGQKDIQKSIDFRHILSLAVEPEVEKIYNYVIQKYNIDEIIKNKGYFELAYDGKNFREKPDPVGRPTNNAKDKRITVRISEDQYKKLKEVVKRKNTTISEIVQDFIKYDL